ncbi:protein of unknown function (DUF4507) [Popillia japonica]|uniref:Uncharacterized protein n=1 Tax=Popillia japonica TaxID=7064 RepID=A0AAW1JT13_POPJA
MSVQETKISLRKIEFPACAKEALSRISQLICRRGPSLSQMDLALDLMAEFVFCEIDKRGNKLPPLNPIKELQLLDILFEYFNGNIKEVFKNTVFLSLFSGTTATLRSRILSKLISIAIGVPSKSVLISASALMQQVGDSSMNYNKLAEAIVKDYFVLIPNATQRLSGLPDFPVPRSLLETVVLWVTANSKLCIAAQQNPSPRSLLETVVLWVTANSKLCIAAQQNPSALPSGTIVMESTTSIAGLLKWCILAPIYKQDSELYANLHLGLLNNILDIPQGYQPKAINHVHLAVPIRYIYKYAASLVRKKDEAEKNRCLLEDVNLQLSLDRYAQAVQVALSTNCVYGNVGELLNQLSQLPQNKLWSIVIAANQPNK